MSHDVGQDQFAVIKVEGMHCHRCEAGIRKALQAEGGVHEVEVDFNSRLVSVLYDRSAVSVARLMEVVNQAGYKAVGFSLGQADPAPAP